MIVKVMTDNNDTIFIENPYIVTYKDNISLVSHTVDAGQAIIYDNNEYLIYTEDSHYGEKNCDVYGLSDDEIQDYFSGKIKDLTIKNSILSKEKAQLEKELLDSQLAITEIFEMISTMGG